MSPAKSESFQTIYVTGSACIDQLTEY